MSISTWEFWHGIPLLSEVLLTAVPLLYPWQLLRHLQLSARGVPGGREWRALRSGRWNHTILNFTYAHMDMCTHKHMYETIQETISRSDRECSCTGWLPNGILSHYPWGQPSTGTLWTELAVDTPSGSTCFVGETPLPCGWRCWHLYMCVRVIPLDVGAHEHCSPSLCCHGAHSAWPRLSARHQSAIFPPHPSPAGEGRTQ